MENGLNFTESLKKTLSDRGVSKVWLSKKLDKDKQTIYNKFRTGDWTETEKIAIKSILNLD